MHRRVYGRMAGFRYLSSVHLLGFNRYKVRTLLRPPRGGITLIDPEGTGPFAVCVGVEGGRGQLIARTKQR